MTDAVTIVEVGPRDGLQNEPGSIPTEAKIVLVDALGACGFRRIETASFVSPRRVPQMADGAAVLAGIARRPGVAYTALTPNLRGYEAARAAGADGVAIFAAASESFSQRNLSASIAQSLASFAEVATAAARDGLPLRGYVSCVVGCPYEGAVPPGTVAGLVERLLAMGCHEVSLGDTIGVGTPASVGAMLRAVLAVAPPGRLAGHYHDTSGAAADCVGASLDLGLRVFDSAIAGLGGCPFAPGARGNLDTTTLVTLLQGWGGDSGVDGAALARADALARRITGRSGAGVASP